MVYHLKVYINIYVNINIHLILDESIPIRLFLQAYNNLTPSFINVNNKFSVQYYLNLVLIDFDDRRYFKQMEINLVRLDKRKKND